MRNLVFKESITPKNQNSKKKKRTKKKIGSYSRNVKFGYGKGMKLSNQPKSIYQTNSNKSKTQTLENLSIDYWREQGLIRNQTNDLLSKLPTEIHVCTDV